MVTERFEVIVVGGGMAGSAAAYRAAQAGAKVLLIERGQYGGAKNVTGGRLYTHALEVLMPDFRERAPLERKVKKERVTIMRGREATTIEYTAGKDDVAGESYTILRATFDKWFQSEVEAQGATVITSIQVTDLIREGNRVVGVRCGKDEVYGDLVIIAEGANTMLSEKAGLRKTPSADHMAVGVKEVYTMPKGGTWAERLGLEENEGVAWLTLGDMTDGIMGGGFVYTNKDTMSVGLVVGLHDIGNTDKTIEMMLHGFTSSPTIAPLLKGATLTERSGHMVPEGGYHAMPNLGGDGYLMTGDAASMCMNLGFTVRGMDLAIASGMYAADAFIAAKSAGKPDSCAALYKELIARSFAGKDLKLYRNLPGVLGGTKRIFTTYPDLVNDIMGDVFKVNGEGTSPIMKKIMARVRPVGLVGLGTDMLKGVRSL